MSELPRVALLTSPSLFGAIIINELAAESGIQLVGVGLTARMYKGKGLVGTVRTLVQRTGWRYTAYNALLANVAWTRLRLSGRPAGLRNVSVRHLRDVNSAKTIAWLKELRPDYVASYYFNQWIGPEVRAVPNQACVNLHPSLLPALRGPDPIFRTLERNLELTGLTLHLVDEGFDTGQILYQEERPVPPGISQFGLYRQQVEDGAKLLARWMSQPYGAQEVVRLTPADAALDDYRTFPTAEEVAEFERSGKLLIGPREFRDALRAIR